MDIPHTRAYRIPDGDYPRAALPRRPMYRGDRVSCFLMGVAVGLVITLSVMLAYAAEIKNITIPTIIEWEHGFRTDTIIVTRYANPRIGLNIGFRFVEPYVYHGDRLEIFKFMESNNGFVYQGGGYLGAELLVIFKDVKTKEQANEKIKNILIQLDLLLQELSQP